MLIESIRIANFRNLRSVEFMPAPGFNLIHGDNGQGKTNFLEAIHLLSTLRSFRSFRNRELIEGGEELSRLEASVDRGGSRRVVRVEIRPRGKQVRINDKGLRNLSEFFGTLNCVVFTPEDLALFRGSPQARRLLLDRLIFQAVPGYADEMRAYEEALRQRNALLKDPGSDPMLLKVYTEQVVSHGSVVLGRRLAWMKRIGPPVQRAFREIFGEEIEPLLSYRPSIRLSCDEDAERGEIEDALCSALERSKRQDHARGFTTVGPHRDDLQASLNGHDVRERASQGQHRSLVLSVKCAEIQLLNEVFGHAPVFLLDDVSSELDPERNRRFYAFVESGRGQVFLTTTDPAHVPIRARCRMARMRGGALQAEGAGVSDSPGECE